MHASFDVNASGNAQNIVFADEGRLKMLEGAVSDTLSKWSFPKPEWGTERDRFASTSIAPTLKLTALSWLNASFSYRVIKSISAGSYAT